MPCACVSAALAPKLGPASVSCRPLASTATPVPPSGSKGEGAQVTLKGAIRALPTSGVSTRFENVPQEGRVLSALRPVAVSSTIDSVCGAPANTGSRPLTWPDADSRPGVGAAPPQVHHDVRPAGPSTGSTSAPEPPATCVQYGPAGLA